MSGDAELRELRERVSETTKEIMRLVASRNELSRRIGRIKSGGALPIEDDAVEDALLKEVLAECGRLGVDKALGERVFNILVAESKRLQTESAAEGRPQTPLVTPTVMAAKAMEAQRSGRKLLRLDVGEPDFHPPQAVLEACSGALFSFKTHYAQTRGIPPLIDALRNYLRRRHSYEAGEKQMVVTPGGRFAIYSALSTLLREGDRCVVIEPNWPAYKEGIRYIGARATVVHTELGDGWEPVVERVKEVIRSNTKAMVLSYPGNPTGKIVDPRLFSEIVGVANDRGVTVVSDEIYTDYSYRACPSILDLRPERFILTSSFSKTWAMTGFRVGYAVSSEDVISRMMKAVALMMTSVPEFIQYGAIKALESDSEVKRNSAEMKERIDAACLELDRIPGLEYYRPDGAMYVFPRAKDRGFDSSSFAMKLLEEKGVTVSPGSGFGDYNDCFRISLGQSKETVVEGIRRIGELLR